VTTPRPLTGLRVLDFTTAWAGPMACRILAVFGADVIKLESPTVFDVWRGPAHGGDASRYPNRDPGERPINRNAWFNTQNHAKRSLVVDLKSTSASRILDDLMPTIDVVVCNYGPGVLDRLGLGFQKLQTWRRDIILLEMPVAGVGGEWSSVSGVGPTMEALAGMTALTGYGDGEPIPTGPAYLDPVGAYNAAFAVLIGLRAREMTGAAQHIELAQQEAALHWCGEYLLRAASTGDWPRPDGNALSAYAPHDAFPALGTDEWVAIAVQTDEQWRSLCEVIGRRELGDDSRYALARQRARYRDEVDAIVRQWTKDIDKQSAAAQLQRHGVPAAPVLSAAELFADPQLEAAGFYIEFEHPEAGRHRYQGLPFHFGSMPIDYGRPSPCLGEHTAEVLAEVGMPQDEIEALAALGTIAISPAAASPGSRATRTTKGKEQT